MCSFHCRPARCDFAGDAQGIAGLDAIGAKHQCTLPRKVGNDPLSLKFNIPQRYEMQIGKETVVTIHYTLTDEKGVVLDSSAGEEPLTFVHGAGTMIPGLEKGLLGRSAGDSLKVAVAPADGYGVRDEELVQKVPRKNFPVEDVEVGMHFQTRSPSGPRIVTVLATDDENITVDANHPLAGTTLNFDVQVLAVRAATPEDLSPPSCGSCESCSGHHHH